MNLSPHVQSNLATWYLLKFHSFFGGPAVALPHFGQFGTITTSLCLNLHPGNGNRYETFLDI
ncbi:hypothetical protein E6H16_08600 [Candidatus Bathyarchaeota archaeon]|nr:MAG: hypothetical protein E6H16_08600 [Candidatus Bathyarchaeota archaeon]